MTMTSRISAVVWILSCTIALPPALAQAPASEGAGPEGFWGGAVAVPTGELPVGLEIEDHGDGSWSGTIDMPVLGIRYMNLDDVTVDGAAVLIKLTAIPGEPTFNGSVSEDGLGIAGNFVQGTQIFPFALERMPRPEGFGDLDALYAEYEKTGTPGEGLVGTWRGLLDIGPIRLRILLKVAAADDGSLLASVEGVDRQQTVPASSVTLGEDRGVVVDLASVGTRFTGTMSEDGSEIPGEWKERGSPLPITFRRAGAE
jgi:hypothetical protein